jgi:two-component system, OmpR family, phosphate regulon sensor histidine kinase PhoR
MSRILGIKWKLAAAFFLVTLAILSSVGIYLLEWTENYYVKAISDDLSRETKAVAGIIAQTSPKDVPGVVTRIGRDLGHRVTVVRSEGTVTADSQSDFRRMPNHADRPEIREALRSGFGTATRYSSTLKIDMLYVATRADFGGGVSGVVRVSQPLSGLHEVLSNIQRTFLLAVIIALVLAGAVSLKIAASITAPVENIAAAARKLAGGDLRARTRAPEKPMDELGTLAQTFNKMAGQLETMITETSEQRSRMQTVFDRTDDGLVLVGPDGRIQMANPASCRILGIGPCDATGKTVIEGTLNHDLDRIVDRVVRTQEPAALDIAVPAGEGSAVHVYAAPVSGTAGVAGVLAVLHDVTESRQLDAIRRDFVANVSHELRTPLASIKAMAETILLRYQRDVSVVPQFAESIVREADRMTVLADDLLDLAKIESGHKAVNGEKADLHKLTQDILMRLSPSAGQRSIELTSEVPASEIVQADSDSVIQILCNLVDNAIKYSHDGGNVTVRSRRMDNRVVISVADNGIGISKDDLPRVFERFYRVDRARSRQSGGTGLGLSIVKHLVELHGGTVSVTSEVDKGTTFSFSLQAG